MVQVTLFSDFEDGTGGGDGNGDDSSSSSNRLLRKLILKCQLVPETELYLSSEAQLTTASQKKIYLPIT